MSSVYERELKGLLAGEEDVLRRVTKALAPDVANDYHRSLARPFLVVRAAGSLGADLVALRWDFSFPIEVKSSSRPLIHFSDGSGKNHEQAERMLTGCARAGVIALYAFRLKNARGQDPWRIFTLPTSGLASRPAVLHDRLPKVERTTGGAFVLRWDDGMPLHRFLDYLAFLARGAPDLLQASSVASGRHGA